MLYLVGSQLVFDRESALIVRLLGHVRRVTGGRILTKACGDMVIPQVVNGRLSKHDLLFLGLGGQVSIGRASRHSPPPQPS